MTLNEIITKEVDLYYIHRRIVKVITGHTSLPKGDAEVLARMIIDEIYEATKEEGGDVNHGI